LQLLDVSSNAFSGEIPATLCNGGNLTKLILFNNAFSGRFRLAYRHVSHLSVFECRTIFFLGQFLGALAN
jgi:hypothetical protein